MFAWDIWITAHLHEYDYLLRLIVACLCGALVGLERTRQQKEAGLRTHLIVALGSAMFMLVSLYAFPDGMADLSRVAAGVASGIGFLGAGVIFVRGASVRGLTTAAGIWVISAIGLAIGAGMYTLGIVVSFILFGAHMIFHKWTPGDLLSSGEIQLIYDCQSPDVLQQVHNRLRELHVAVLGIDLSQQGDKTVCTLSVRLTTPTVTGDLLNLPNEFPQITNLQF